MISKESIITLLLGLNQKIKECYSTIEFKKFKCNRANYIGSLTSTRDKTIL